MPWIVGWRGTLDLFAQRAKLLEFFYGDVFTSNFENLGP